MNMWYSIKHEPTPSFNACLAYSHVSENTHKTRQIKVINRPRATTLLTANSWIGQCRVRDSEQEEVACRSFMLLLVL